MSKSRFKKTLSILVVIIITVLALVYALWDVDFPKLKQVLAEGDYWVVLPINGLLFLFFWLKAIRWSAILRPIGRFTTLQVTPSMMIGFAGNNVLPGRIGEFMRTVVFARRYKKPMTSVLISIVVERLFDVIAVLVLYELAIVMLGDVPASLQIGAWLIGLLLAGILLVIILTLWRSDSVLSLWDKVSFWLPDGLQIWIRGAINNGIIALSSLKSPGLVAVLLVSSLLKWGLNCVIIWYSLEAYGSVVAMEITAILLAVLSLASAVPNAPGFVGATQVAFVFALRPFGISEEIAFAASVLYLVSQWIPVTVIGACYFVVGGLEVSEVRREVEEVEDASIS